MTLFLLQYFDMRHNDAIRALEIYKKAGNQVYVAVHDSLLCVLPKIWISLNVQYGTCVFLQGEQLSEFFEIFRGLNFGQGQKLVKIEQVWNLNLKSTTCVLNLISLQLLTCLI